MYRNDRIADTASGGVAIIIKRNITHHQILLPHTTILETVGIRVQCQNNNDFVLICAYKPPKMYLHIPFMSLLFPTTERTFLLGDLNSKHISWGCRVTNPNGTRLYDFINNHGLHIVAPSEPTYYPYNPNIQPDILDIGIQKNMLQPAQVVSLTALDSDHCPVLISFQMLPNTVSHVQRLINGYVDWEKFKLSLDSQLTQTYHPETSTDIDSCVEHFTNTICSSVKYSTLGVNRPLKRYYLPSSILQLIQEKHRIRRLWQRERQLWQRRRLNQLIRQVRVKLEEHRLQSYQSYLSSLSVNDNTLWQATKKILREPTLIPALHVDSQIIVDTEDKCNVLASHYQNIFMPKNYINLESNQQIEDELQKNINKPYVPERLSFTTPQELTFFIQRLPNKKSPGHDLIPNVVLKKLTKKALVYLTTVFNSALRIGYFPKTWKKAEIIVFQKPNKPKHSPSSYRPISLLSTLSKLFEKIIHKRLSTFIYENNILPDFQFGFRPKHSTTHQLLRITQTIIQGYERKQYTAAVFLDIAQAFDTVWYDGLILKLYRIGLPYYLINIIKSFLTDRQFVVRIEGTKSTPRPINAGVPQGSILSPLLFNIFTYDLPNLAPSGVAMYADDTVIFYSHYNLNTAVETLQTSLLQISEWYSKWRIQINTTKTEAKVFSLRPLHDITPLYLFNEQITWLPCRKAVKYLGVLLDTRLTWNAHITRIVTLAQARISKLYPLINRRSKIGLECSKLLYTSLVRPLITYAASVWGTANKTHIHRLQVLQNKFLRTATNAPWFVRNQQLHYEMGILPLNQYIRQLTKVLFMKLPDVPGATAYNIGTRTLQPSRLKRRLPQDILLSDIDNDSEDSI